jgi:hypothetical protein
MSADRCEDCGRQASTPEDAKRYAGGEGEHLCWGGCEPASPAELRAEIERLRGERDRLARVLVGEAWLLAEAIDRVGAAAYLRGLGLACTVDDVDRIFAGCRTPWGVEPEEPT